MLFSIRHETRYQYEHEASESFMEVRLTPPSNRHQSVRQHRLRVTPSCQVSGYTDYFGNRVESFSIIHAHDSLQLLSESEVETHPVAPPPEAFALSVSEARQIFHAERLRYYDFVHPSPAVQPDHKATQWARRHFPAGADFGECIHALMHAIHGRFRYEAGVTGVDTTVAEVFRLRKGVCQDFAHVMIAVLRAAGIPARYVVGYIETESQRLAAARGERQLVGAAESHAWVEIALPNGDWYALDPTNDIPAGERHVIVAVGRDFHDTSPTRGVFKGAGKTTLTAKVDMRRLRPG